jgi:hypothetical protein
LQYRIRCNRFRIRAEQTHYDRCHGRCHCQHCAFGRDVVQMRVKAPTGRFRRRGPPKQNTGDLQWKSDAICNVRACKGERNAASARTMGSNEKTMRRTMGNNEISGGVPTSGCSIGRSPDSAARQSTFRVRLGAIPTRHFCLRPCAPAKSNARPKCELGTRECHSALTAMRGWHRNRKPDLIYPRYSGVRRTRTGDAPI